MDKEIKRAEHRRVRPNSQGQRENRHRREPRRFAQHPQPVSDVLKKSLHAASRLPARVRSGPMVSKDGCHSSSSDGSGRVRTRPTLEHPFGQQRSLRLRQFVMQYKTLSAAAGVVYEKARHLSRP